MRRHLIISCLVGVVAGLLGAIQIQRSGDTSAKIKGVETKLTEAFQPKPLPIPPSLKGKAKSIVQIAPAWSGVQDITKSLIWYNKRIAEAKAMLHYDSYHKKMDSYIWEEKESLAHEPWLIEETSQLVLNRLYGGSVYAFGGFVVTFLLLIFWSWRFLLARIRELSDAIPGK